MKKNKNADKTIADYLIVKGMFVRITCPDLELYTRFNFERMASYRWRAYNAPLTTNAFPIDLLL